MILKMYSIRDSKGGVYHRPFYKAHEAEAERDFKTGVNDEKSTMYLYPEDYDLYYVGEYDDETGTIRGIDTPRHVAKAINLKRPVSV